MIGKPNNESKIIYFLRLSSEFSSIAKLIMNTMHKKVEPKSQILINKSINDYIKTLNQVKRYVETYDANFYHFLQPVFTKLNHNNYE